MKKLLVLVVVLLAAWLAINYFRTGTLSLNPAGAHAESQEVRDLRDELKAIEAKIESAGRAAGLTGVDTTGDVAALDARRKEIEKRLAALGASR